MLMKVVGYVLLINQRDETVCYKKTPNKPKRKYSQVSLTLLPLEPMQALYLNIQLNIQYMYWQEFRNVSWYNPC